MKEERGKLEKKEEMMKESARERKQILRQTESKKERS